MRTMLKLNNKSSNCVISYRRINVFIWFVRKITFSRVTIKVLTTWQFCSTTHVPFFTPSSMRASAMTPWPWPRDKENSLLAPKPWSSANFSRIAMGSAPGVRTNISGMQECESAKDATRSKGGGTMYWRPNCSIGWSKFQVKLK